MLRIVRQIKLKIALGAMVALCSVVLIAIAIAFASMAVYFALCLYLPPILAALATAGLALATLLLVFLLAKLIAAIAGSRRASDPQRDAAFLGELVGRRLGADNKRNSVIAMAVALSAGFAVGASPKLRGILFDIIRR